MALMQKGWWDARDNPRAQSSLRIPCARHEHQSTFRIASPHAITPKLYSAMPSQVRGGKFNKP